jgi:predicted LPLAT superfamily acyltransferase
MEARMSLRSPAAALHWSRINEVGFLAGMWLLFSVYKALGRWPFRALLYPVLGWYLLIKPSARKASSVYLKRVRKAAQARRGLTVFRHFSAFAECILDKALLWGGLLDVSSTVCHGQDELAADIASGRGGLIVCSHFGNLELCRVLGRRHAGLKMTVLVHTRHAKKFNELLASLDESSRLDLVQVTEISPATAIALAEKVGRGEFIVIAGDRTPVSNGRHVVPVEFLGAPAPLPTGPYILASLLQCPVYLMFSMRRGHGFEIRFERFRDMIRLPRQQREEGLRQLAQDYARRLEHYCMIEPLQWFNFYDFWHFPDEGTNDASR